MDLSRRELIAALILGTNGSFSIATGHEQSSRGSAAGNEPQHRDVKSNGIRIHFAEQGTGPLVILCHGFPESWYSWRHQLAPIAGAGFRVVAPDMRGYGRTEIPPEVSSYNIMELVGDMVGLVAALGERQAVIVGHDWGATVAWNATLFRPDVFPAVAALSVPFRLRGTAPPLRLLRQAGLYNHYWLYYQDPGIAEAEFERDPSATVRRMLFTMSGDGPRNHPTLMLQPGEGFLDNMVEPEHLPAWLTSSDIKYLAAEFSRTGFRGGLNWYRNIDHNWAITAPWAGALIRQPALFMYGTEDPVFSIVTGKAALESLSTNVPGLKRQMAIEGAGHHIQQERPQIVSTALVDYLRGLSAWG